uniref:Uncharacterized protein n=2 Tax=viral metagenome TaxID=1070528 RepID=A0A6M3LB39_9ZZZZ
MIYKKIEKVEEAGSCMFCQRGELESKTILKYPYESVYVISSDRASSFRICSKCLVELIKLVRN